MNRWALFILAVIFALLSQTGCANKVILYPIEKSDIQAMKAGIPYSPEKDGYYVSSFYMKEIMEAKIR